MQRHFSFLTLFVPPPFPCWRVGLTQNRDQTKQKTKNKKKGEKNQANKRKKKKEKKTPEIV
jgi:hypothetical protein